MDSAEFFDRLADRLVRSVSCINSNQRLSMMLDELVGDRVGRPCSFAEMPSKFDYKGHTYYLDELYGETYSLDDPLRLVPMYRYLYGRCDDQMFLWVTCLLDPIEDDFDYDQFLENDVIR